MTGAWIILVRSCGAKARNSTLAAILLISQVGKYLPGNVAHFIGRAWASQQKNISFKAVAAATALELSGVLAACSILVAMALVLAGGAPQVSYYSHWILAAAVALSIAGTLLGGLIAFRSGVAAIKIWKPFLTAVGCYASLLALLACVNIWLIYALSGSWNWSLAIQVAGAFAVSWLVGFIMPGSPAGLGVRELAFFAILAGSISEEILVISTAIFRIATISGDFLAWGAGMAVSHFSSDTTWHKDRHKIKEAPEPSSASLTV